MILFHILYAYIITLWRIYRDTEVLIENLFSIHWLCQTYSCIDWSMVYHSNEIKAAKGESYLANLIFFYLLVQENKSHDRT